MSSANYYKAPPRKTDHITYDNWKKEVKIWEFQSNLDNAKRGSALLLSLEGKPRETVLAEVEIDQINCEDGVKNIFIALDRFYKKDEAKSAYFAFDDFVKYKRDPKMSLKDYLIEFNLKQHRIENFNMKLPTGVLAYLLLSCSNISQEKMEICRATCSELTYDKMKETIEKVGVGSSSSNTATNDTTIKFSSQEQVIASSSQAPCISGLQIKQEPAFLADGHMTMRSFNDAEQSESFDMPEEDVLYGYNRNKTFNSGRSFSRQRPGSNNANRNYNRKNFGNFSFNPPDAFGNPLTCKYCHSVCHLVSKCPDCPEHLKRRYQPSGAYNVSESSEYL